MYKINLLIILVIFLCAGCSSAISNGAVGEDRSPVAAASPSMPAAPAAEAQAKATPTPAPNAICSDPAKPCSNKTIPFDEWALSFKLPAKVQPNKTYRSAPFFAILVKTMQAGEEDLCDGGEFIESMEQERKELQEQYPDRKVFASYSCPNMGATGYDFPGSYDPREERALIDNFIAVYAGQTEDEAKKLLPTLKATYPKAAIKPMTATQEWIYQ